MKRTKLCHRQLPKYTFSEEILNTVTHIIGGMIGLLALLLGLYKTIPDRNLLVISSVAIYGSSMIVLYTMSSVYHGLKPSTAKKVMQVIDHCTIYLFIAGTYTPISLVAIGSVYPQLGLGLFVFQWTLAALAITLTAIDLHRYRVFSMFCYIGLGWAIIPFVSQAMAVLTPVGFHFLLGGGIAYTVGAIVYGFGTKRKWFHSVFHIFVVIGSTLQLISILGYAIK
ncbi:MAG: hemolysin III family protein [Ruminococcaceae bacterium]|nr:hemolysin III family protein [Oscillospiraceae bacterium]